MGGGSLHASDPALIRSLAEPRAGVTPYFVGCDEWGFDAWTHNACHIRVGVTDDLAKVAFAYRKSLPNPLTGKNVLVYEYVNKVGTISTKVLVSAGKHTERMIPEGTKVLRIFSEREPCKHCFNYIEKVFPTSQITYLFPYRDKATRVPTYIIQSIFKKMGL